MRALFYIVCSGDFSVYEYSYQFADDLSNSGSIILLTYTPG